MDPQTLIATFALMLSAAVTTLAQGNAEVKLAMRRFMDSRCIT